MLRRAYGASVGHLVAQLACFAVSAYAITRLFGNPSLLRIAVWFVGAAIAWDFLGGPLLALVDRLLRPLRRPKGGVALLNYVRAPLLLSVLLLLVWLPVIFARSEQRFRLKAGLSQDPYLGRWIVITLLLFAVSLGLYGLRRLRARGPGRGHHSGATPSSVEVSGVDVVALET